MMVSRLLVALKQEAISSDAAQILQEQPSF
jgi:hypothetical protein